MLKIGKKPTVFHDIDDDDISGSSSIEGNGQLDFVIISQKSEELMNEEDFDKEVLEMYTCVPYEAFGLRFRRIKEKKNSKKLVDHKPLYMCF
ncbi:hypothetical protein TNCV_3577621 [Trichonephila clavipes]|uniref:Uncharacterized protein n=1 Tax=Trichonephila clavipes TaxID=2585209 RepID=A0A8X6RMI6_TRICX|nr:hypothetical protein TNCV_3577621 [Trichonephila clavipes]